MKLNLKINLFFLLLLLVSCSLASNQYWQRESTVFVNSNHPQTSYYFDDPGNIFYEQSSKKTSKNRSDFLSRGVKVLKFYQHRYRDDSFAGLESKPVGDGGSAEWMFKGGEALFHSFYFDVSRTETRRLYSFAQEKLSIYDIGYKLNISLYDLSEEGARHYLKSLVNGSFYLKAGLEMAKSQAAGSGNAWGANYGVGFEWGTEFGLFTEYIVHTADPIESAALKLGMVLRFP